MVGPLSSLYTLFLKINSLHCGHISWRPEKDTSGLCFFVWKSGHMNCDCLAMFILCSIILDKEIELWLRFHRHLCRAAESTLESWALSLLQFQWQNQGEQPWTSFCWGCHLLESSFPFSLMVRPFKWRASLLHICTSYTDILRPQISDLKDLRLHRTLKGSGRLR